MEPSNRSTVPHTGIIIPALNEESAIAQVLKEIPPGIIEQVIVVDNGSTDRTSEIAAQSGAQVVREPQRGYGSACLAGIRALSSDIEIVVFMDGDHSDHPEQLPNLLNPILDGQADFVLGTRSTDPGSAAALTAFQRWGNHLATSLMRRFWGYKYTDLGPFRAIGRDSLELLSMSDPDFGWTVEMQIKAAIMGLRILELPVSYRARIGKSKVSGTFKGSILAGAKILFTIFSYAFLDWTRRIGRRELCVR
jgi:glycosyltransferase involved in cell wall biosynthesis